VYCAIVVSFASIPNGLPRVQTMRNAVSIFPFPLVVNFRQQKPWWGFKNLVAGTVDTVGVEHRLVDHILAAVAVAADHIAAVAAEEVVQRWEHCQKSQN